jgi:hypothetical protein
MNHDWMNDPELDQLPTAQRAEQIENLKLLAEREQPQTPPSQDANSQVPPQVPSHYVTSLTDLRKPRNAVLPTPPVPVPNPAPKPKSEEPVQANGAPIQANGAPIQANGAPVTLIPTPPPNSMGVSPSVRLASLELKNVVDMDRRSKERGKLLPECADALMILGVELGIESTMEHIAEVLRSAYQQSRPNPNDRYSTLERAFELRATKLSWEKVVSQLNAEGYRNQQGEPWKMHALRRACERHAEKTGRNIFVRGAKAK